MIEKKAKEKINTNIFKVGYYPWRLCNIFRNIKHFFKTVKWGWQRATRGYSDRDCWDLDYFYLNIFYKSLNQLADNTNSYPNGYTYEEWQNYLRDIADEFYYANEANEGYINPYEEEYEAELDTWSPGRELSEIDHKFLDSEIEIDEQRKTDFAAAWSKMGEIFFNLWD